MQYFNTNIDLFLNIAGQGVVHVAINYRLGALGFTALEGEAWGNQGLRDQVVPIFGE